MRSAARNGAGRLTPQATSQARANSAMIAENHDSSEVGRVDTPQVHCRPYSDGGRVFVKYELLK